MKHSVPIVAGISRGWRWLLVGKQSLGSGSLGSLRLSSFSFIYLNVALPLPLAAGDKKKSARPWRQEDFLPPAVDESGAQVPISAVSLSAYVRGGRRQRRMR